MAAAHLSTRRCAAVYFSATIKSKCGQSPRRAGQMTCPPQLVDKPSLWGQRFFYAGGSSRGQRPPIMGIERALRQAVSPDQSEFQSETLKPSLGRVAFSALSAKNQQETAHAVSCFIFSIRRTRPYPAADRRFPSARHHRPGRCPRHPPPARPAYWRCCSGRRQRTRRSPPS